MPLVLYQNGEMQLNAEVSRLRREVADLKRLVARLLDEVQSGLADDLPLPGDYSEQN